MMNRFIALLAFCCIALFAQGAPAGTVPVNIQADTMRYSPSGKEVVFKGNVKVTRQDVTINAETITIYLGGEAKSEPGGIAAMDPGAIRKIEATGGVRIDYQGKKGKCAKATYQVLQGLLVMDGDPVLSDGQNSITGHQIKFYLKENRSEVVAGKGQRVNATFHAPDTLKVPGKKDQ